MEALFEGERDFLCVCGEMNGLELDERKIDMLEIQAKTGCFKFDKRNLRSNYGELIKVSFIFLFR